MTQICRKALQNTPDTLPLSRQERKTVLYENIAFFERKIGLRACTLHSYSQAVLSDIDIYRFHRILRDLECGF